MPVPLPTTEEALRVPPDAMEARVLVGGVAGAVQVDGALSSLQRLLLDSLTESMTGFVVPVNHVPRLGPQEFARAMARRDEGFRSRMVQFMLLCALVLVPLPEEVVDRIDAYAAELGVNNDMLRVAHRLAHGSYGLALLDFQRSGYAAGWSPEHSAALHTSIALAEAWEQCVHDDALAARWESLRELPDGTFGRRVADFYDARGFVFPGRHGSAPPLLAQHDWVHVLADYGSTVEAEIEVFAFISRANDDPRAFSLLAQVVSLFETGYVSSGMGLFEYDRGHLSHAGMAIRLADAMRRGAISAKVNSDKATEPDGIDFFEIDWFAYASRPLDDVRAQLGIVPKSPRAIDAGSVGPWERGGMSAYQYEAGRAAATAAGREYDSFGAAPV